MVNTGASSCRCVAKDVRLVAPGTPLDGFELQDSFFASLPEPKPKKGRKRLFFILGGLLGGLVAWLFAEGPSNLPGDLDMTYLSSFARDLPGLPDVSISELSKRFSLGMDDIIGPTKQWLKSSSFEVGRLAYANGARKKYNVVMIPGIVSSGLESWSTAPEHSSYFRQRVWGTTTMVRALLTKKEAWIKAMMLDPETGLDMAGTRVRSAQGLDAASYFLAGYWVWARVIENLAALNYAPDDLYLAAYDWRLSYSNLQLRDHYFSQLQAHIEHSLRVTGRKTLLVSHSMGALVVLYFFKWAESPEHGRGGDDWCERHISGWANIAGTLLGVPKAMAALLSGEMRDTVELNPAASRVLEMAFSRQERAQLFRSWAGSASMWLKGGSRIWGDEAGSPDDLPGRNHSFAHMYRFAPGADSIDVTINHQEANMTMDEASAFLLQNTPTAYQRMIESNWSFGFSDDPDEIIRNDKDPRKWTNPLEIRLPYAPSMRIDCLYGHGKPTERAYYYRADAYEPEEGLGVDSETARPPQDSCPADDLTCNATSTRPPLDLPLRPKLYVDSAITIDGTNVRSGVVMGEGDGTVSVLSLGAMCVKGWTLPRYNPAGIEVVTRELLHEPERFDPRGGATTADHIDVLGATELNAAIVALAAGQTQNLTERLYSDIRAYTDKIKW